MSWNSTNLGSAFSKFIGRRTKRLNKILTFIRGIWVISFSKTVCKKSFENFCEKKHDIYLHLRS